MNNNQKQKRNKWLAFINIPVQMGVIIFLFSVLGNWLDEKFINKHTIYVKICTLVGVAIAFYNLNQQLKEINKQQD